MNQQPSKIICVGRNYAEHARELGNEVPEAPVLFIKPPSSLRSLQAGIDWNKALGECHFECELSIQIGQRLQHATPEQAKAAISGVTLGLDLTLRDLQNKLKNKGQPWERAKAFDGACVLGEWLSPQELGDLTNTRFELSVNEAVRQQGNTADMLFGVVDLLVEISQVFTLEVGDVVMTGTPAGVAALQSGDTLNMTLHTVQGEVSWQTFVR
ncbi:fumarylacetoacetate hydrolase family protein [Alkanindiges sp. WGS2144]|uniref:fumarylacetoacetate hydrolase family protein n=1 Tax=Alkanindiges sp. WGS2144 TaxID=3366808 RepID=UPI003753B609